MFCYCTVQLCSSHFSSGLVIQRLKVTGSGAKLVGGGGKVTFLKIEKKSPNFGKKCPDSGKKCLVWVHLWVKFSFKIQFKSILEKKHQNFGLQGPSFVCHTRNVHRSPLFQETSPAPKTSWLHACGLFLFIIISPNLFRY